MTIYNIDSRYTCSSNNPIDYTISLDCLEGEYVEDITHLDHLTQYEYDIANDMSSGFTASFENQVLIARREKTRRRVAKQIAMWEEEDASQVYTEDNMYTLCQAFTSTEDGSQMSEFSKKDWAKSPSFWDTEILASKLKEESEPSVYELVEEEVEVTSLKEVFFAPLSKVLPTWAAYQEKKQQAKEKNKMYDWDQAMASKTTKQ